MQIKVGECVVDTGSRQVLRHGREVPLSPKAFHLLSLLATTRPKALSKDELHRALWPDTFVVEANLSNIVGEIRAALGDSAREPRFIRTVHGYGYACCAGTSADVQEARRAVFWLIFGAERVSLSGGDNVVGRSAEADVRLNVPGVSRRHAKIVIEGEAAFVEDLGSKNGTFVGNERIETRCPIGPHDDIVFGSARVRVCRLSPTDATETL